MKIDIGANGEILVDGNRTTLAILIINGVEALVDRGTSSKKIKQRIILKDISKVNAAAFLTTIKLFISNNPEVRIGPSMTIEEYAKFYGDFEKWREKRKKNKL